MKQDNPGWLARHALAVRARLRGKPRPPVVPSAKARGDWLVRFCTVIAVASVAGVAAYISYWHAVEVVTSHGEQAVRGHLYPVVIDGITAWNSIILQEVILKTGLSILIDTDK